MTKTKIKICFYARVPDQKLFETVNFYSNDIKILRELNYEVILSNNYKNIPSDCDLYFIWWWSSGIVPLIKAKLIGKPSIMIGNLHLRDKSKQGYSDRPFYIKLFIKYCLRNSDVQITTSKVEHEDVKLFRARNPVLIYHAIDESKYFFSQCNREKYILAITRLLKLNIERKRLLETLEAFRIVLREFSDYNFIIVGRKEDDGYADIIAKINSLELQDKVIVLGSISEEEKIKYLKKCMVFVQPTTYEGFGMAIAESMACGTPVVTSPNGAVPEVANDLAVYVNQDSPEDIARGIMHLLKDKILYDKLSTEGSKRIGKLFSIEKRKEELQKLLGSLL